MNTQQEKRNYFKIKLMQEDISLYESIFDADEFNPFTRYSVDIRDILPEIINGLQKLMSRNKQETHTNHTNNNYDLLEYAKEMFLAYQPKSTTQYIEDADITLRGVKCAFGLYINDKPIVERDFYVDGFNAMCRWSVDLTDLMNLITYNIKEKIKNTDIKNTWDDHDMIHILGYDFVEIKNFSPETRRNAIRKLERRKV